MLATIIDYLLTVLVRAIIGYGFLIMIALVIFVGYVVFTDWTIAVDFVDRIANNDFAKITIWLPLFFSLFKADSEGNAKGKVSRRNTDLYLLTNNSIWL